MALENALKVYEKRHPQSVGLIEGSVVVPNGDSAILAERWPGGYKVQATPTATTTAQPNRSASQARR